MITLKSLLPVNHLPSKAIWHKRPTLLLFKLIPKRSPPRSQDYRMAHRVWYITIIIAPEERHNRVLLYHQALILVSY